MLGVLPPAQLYVQRLHPRAQPHVRQAQERQADVIPDGMGTDPLGSQSGEAGIEFGRQRSGAVVLLQEALRLAILTGVVKGARGQTAGIDAVAVPVPVDLAGRGKVGSQAPDPADKAGKGKLSRVVSVARRQRLKDMERAFVAQRPGGKGKQRKQRAKHGEAQSSDPTQGAAAIDNERDPQHHGQQRTIGTKQRSIAPGKDEQGRPDQAGLLQHPRQRAKTQRDAEDGEGFGQRRGGIKRGEGQSAASSSATRPARCPQIFAARPAISRQVPKSMIACRYRTA